jgi:hypothetical protein
MVVYGLALGNQRQLNGGDFSIRADELWSEAACASRLSVQPHGLCGGGRDLSRAVRELCCIKLSQFSSRDFNNRRESLALYPKCFNEFGVPAQSEFESNLPGHMLFSRSG